MMEIWFIEYILNKNSITLCIEYKIVYMLMMSSSSVNVFIFTQFFLPVYSSPRLIYIIFIYTSSLFNVILPRHLFIQCSLLCLFVLCCKKHTMNQFYNIQNHVCLISSILCFFSIGVSLVLMLVNIPREPYTLFTHVVCLNWVYIVVFSLCLFVLCGVEWCFKIYHTMHKDLLFVYENW